MARHVEILMPSEQSEGTQSVVARWLKQVGESVALHEPIVEISTDKVSLEIPAPAAGILREIKKRPNESVQPGEELGSIEVGAAAAVELPKAATAQSASKSSEGSHERLSPAVRRLLKEHGIDASAVKATGADGRLTYEDVLAHVQGGATAGAVSSAASRRVPHSPMRQQIARHMAESVRTAPHVTTVFDADLSAVIAHREKEKESFAKRGVKLTYSSYFIHACKKALQAVPEVNSRWHDDALEIFTDFNIGMAAALEQGGLIVPVLQKVQDLDLFGIASRLQELTEKARGGTLGAPEVRGGTFTISNHGVSGSLVATPIIINQPQSAILGIGKLEKRAVVIERDGKEQIEARPMLYVSLTIDHRVLDGHQANKFLEIYVHELSSF